jgi:ribonuclease HI
MYQATMDSKQTDDQALDSLYGFPLTITRPTHIYVEGAVNAPPHTAGAGIFCGPGSPMNLSLSVPGPGRLTADRARLFGVHEAVKLAPSDTTLVFCTSKMIIRQLCYSAAKNMSLGWPGANPDIFKALVKLLTKRHAQTCFVHVESKAINLNQSQHETYVLAKRATKTPRPASSFLEISTANSDRDCSELHGTDPASRRRKVYT